MGSALAWIYALLETTIQWLTQMEILGVPLLAILVAIFLMGVILSAVLYKS